MCRYHGIVYETLMEDEENQVRGYVHFADGQGVGFSYLTLFTIKEAVRIVKNGEVLYYLGYKTFIDDLVYFIHNLKLAPS